MLETMTAPSGHAQVPATAPSDDLPDHSISLRDQGAGGAEAVQVAGGCPGLREVLADRFGVNPELAVDGGAGLPLGVEPSRLLVQVR